MQVSIENIKVASAIGVLDKLELRGLKSIHRTRLSKLLTEKLKKIAEEEKKLKESYAAKDKKGEPIVKEGKYNIEEKDKLQKDLEAFFYEKIVIDGGDNQVFIKSVKQSLEESEIDWVGKEAYAYADLYNAFEGGEK